MVANRYLTVLPQWATLQMVPEPVVFAVDTVFECAGPYNEGGNRIRFPDFFHYAILDLAIP